MIPINWDRPSACWPWWSNQRSNDIGYGAPTFDGPHKGPSHGYDYNPHNSAHNDPLPTFIVAHERPSHGYDYNPYHTIGNIPSPTFGPEATTCDRDEEEFQSHFEEATKQNQHEYIQKLEEDHRFSDMQRDASAALLWTAIWSK
jgi:hypothetical protein